MADEVVQETMVTAIGILDRYQPRDTFIPWLKGIARNHLLHQLGPRDVSFAPTK